MSWKDNLRQASFRGVPFFVQTTSGSVGRKTALHEFPGRDRPFVEDLGRATRKINIDALVLGDNYMADRDDIITAVETAGAGVLVHPYWGELDVTITSPCRIVESTAKGGTATISFECVEAGNDLSITIREATAEAVALAADVAGVKLVSDFAAIFDAVDQFGDLVDGLVATIQLASSAIRAIKGRIDAVMNIIDSVIDAIDEFTSLVASLILLPGQIANQVMGAIASVQGSINKVTSAFQEVFGGSSSNTLLDENGNKLDMTTATEAEIQDAITRLTGDTLDNTEKVNLILESYRDMRDWGDDQVTAPDTTPQRLQEQDSQKAIVRLMKLGSVIETMRVASTITFPSNEIAIATMEELTKDLDDQAEIAPTDDLYYALSDLKAAFVRHITTTASNLPSVSEYTPAVTLPALIVAHNIYGDASKDLEIVERNTVKNPNFVLGGAALEVLDYV